MRNLLKWHKNLAEKFMIKTGMNAYKLAWFSWVKGLVMGILLALLLGSCSKNYSCDCTTVTYVPEYCNVCPAGTILGMIPAETTSTDTKLYVNEKNSSDAEASCAEFNQTTVTPPPNNEWNSIPIESLSDSIRTVMTCVLRK